MGEAAVARKRSKHYCRGAFIPDRTCSVVLPWRDGIVTG
jgi:hypothetical protein